MRTILTIDHENRIIQPMKLQRFNKTMNSVKSIKENEAVKLLQDVGRFTRYTRKYTILK